MTARVRYLPSEGETPDPRNGPIYAVRYCKRKGETVTALRFRRADALDLAREIADRGGDPRIFRTDTVWTEIKA